MNIYEYLQDLGIEYVEHTHPPVFTCEEAEAHVQDVPGFHTKNLFLRDRKGTRHFLVVVGYEKNVDLKSLADRLEVSKLSFASPERLKQHLDLEPGSVTLLGIINDPEHHVEVILDQAVWDAKSVLSHPLVNTATLNISHEGLEKFLESEGHEYRIVDVPSRA